MEQQATAIREQRARLKAELERTPGVNVFASDANFLLARVPDANSVFAGMKQRGVLVKMLHGSHPLLAQCLRITVGTAAENTLCLTALRASL